MRSLLTALLLAAVAPASAFFQESLMGEYMWCCQDAFCLEACAKMCMGGDHGPGKEAFCPGGSEHPLTHNEWGHRSGRSLEQVQRELFLEPDDLPSQLIDQCGPFRNATDPMHSKWVLCYFDFYGGTEYTRDYCADTLNITCCPSGICGGEPHFKTWREEWYDYHGECDLNFIHAPSFAHGLGLDIHIRTKRRDSYSFIESAAIKIGEDIVEISAFGQYLLNGVEGADLETAQLSAFTFTHEPESKKVHHFSIDAGDHKIKVKTVKDFVSVTLDQASLKDYIDSVGMLGSFGKGTLLGRDGKTVYTVENINEFGQEWQVRPEEPQLFENTQRAPQYPEKCILPDASAQTGRRLGEQRVSQEDAEKACSEWHYAHKDQCVFDVMATGDLELAQAGGY